MGLEFAVLGPPRAWLDGRERALGRPQQRAVLCALLLAPGELVPTQRLITALWGEDEDDWPKDPVGQIGTHAHRLRRALDRPGVLVAGPGGYRLAVAREAVDVFRYENEAGRAVARLRDAPEEARELLARALGRWSGTALDGVPGPLAARTRERLAASRHAAVMASYEAELSLGRHADVLAALRELTAARPEDEEAHRLCLLALYRCGRRAEALALFEALRERLDRRLGLDPGGALTGLFERIRRDGPGLAVPRPCQLPPDIPDLVGRGAQVREAEGLLRSGGGQAGGRVVLLSGPYGAGASTLAVHLAHRVRDAFPDGQLYARGDAPGAVREVLAGFLRALGERPPEGTGEGELAARYRAALAGRRVLVLLDGVREPGPLLPGGAGCATLLTEAEAEEGVAAAAGAEPEVAAGPGAVRLPVGPLDPDDAYELLARIAGPDRIRREADAARELAELCGRLPARLRSAAARLAARPQWSVADLVGRLSG
ncbi:BTAD domain-containing putative transcriptional regulator [Streptomyces sp. NBC_00572]|uniref:AfsR/SARP family transcriptional regulator n=1 Tax=Streptomyces sp. NBC_00572 TaxID=2903664 RepID=UPI0022519126|nr:BTAD domain-containing putative transcriptional regulator [Streptomyces sp. NBC_00572]MCX4983338.1 transcriptional regulator [Streptomyces sp. NBC_00572]